MIVKTNISLKLQYFKYIHYKIRSHSHLKALRRTMFHYEYMILLKNCS